MPRARDKMDRRGSVPKEPPREASVESDVNVPERGGSPIGQRETPLGILADPIRWDEV